MNIAPVAWNLCYFTSLRHVRGLNVKLIHPCAEEAALDSKQAEGVEVGDLKLTKS